MDETDAFFTHAIVGSPQSVLLGRRLGRPSTGAEGLAVPMNEGRPVLTRVWQDWLVLSHACDPVGQPRLRPGTLRRFLERHALWIALLGLLWLLSGAIVWGLQRWI